MKTVLIVMTAALLSVSAPLLAQHRHDDSVEHHLEHLIVRSYVHGAFNELNPAAMERGFHPDFAIFSAKGDELGRYEIADWIQGVAKRKADPEFDAAKNRWQHKIVSLDVTGGAAAAKIELYKDGKLVYTDYLSLLKFESGWRIAAKVYHSHE